MWREALPLGNGLTGVLIPGSIAEEKICFNRHDLWEGGSNRPIPDITETFQAMRASIDRGDYQAANQDNLKRALREKGYETKCDSPHPLGWLHTDFTPSDLFKSYRRGVNMRTGEAFVEFDVDDCHYRRTAFVSRDCDVTVMRMTADRYFTTAYRFELYNQRDFCTVTEDGIHCRSKDGYTEVSIRFAGDFTAAVSENTLSVTGRDYVVYIRCASHGSECSLDGIVDKTYAELFTAHTVLHTSLYDAVSIELASDESHDATNEQMLDDAYDGEASSALLERLWRFGRYLFISAAARTVIQYRYTVCGTVPTICHGASTWLTKMWR